jgi:hypothetical protein
VLDRARGHMTRAMINDVCHKHGVGSQYITGVIQALGPSDPKKRAVFDSKMGKPSLLTLAYVEEREYDIDGVVELGLKITELGRAALRQVEEDLHANHLPPILPESFGDVEQEMSDAPQLRSRVG